MSQSQIAGLGYSNAIKLFKYVLSNKDENPLTLHYTPNGWKEEELTFIRDFEFKGVRESISTRELEFVKEGRDYAERGYQRGAH